MSSNHYSSKAVVPGLDPLKDLLSNVLARLEVLEGKVGVSKAGGGGGGASLSLSQHGSSHHTRSAAVTKANLEATAAENPAVKAYDEYVKMCLDPFVKVCADLGGLQNMGPLLKDAWDGVRTVIVLASKSKPPTEDLATALPPYLEATQEAIKKIRDLRLKRDFDFHYKAVCEMTACLSWVLYRAPQQLPVPMIKEALASAEFWTNRIRKEYKGKDETQIAFCDKLKLLNTGLVSYVESFHKTGLTFNPRGVSLAEAAIRLADDPVTDTKLLKSPVQKRHPTLGSVTAGTNMAGLVGELSKRKSSDGSSAATGLRKVTKDQQTWRKEYKKPGTSTVPSAPKLDAPKNKKEETKKKTPLRGIPIFEYQDRGFKWVVENHTKDSIVKEVSKDGILSIEVTDPKQQVYIYNCDGVTVNVKGKFKSLILDKCANCAVVYETLISSAEVVNSKKIQLQVTGVCPVFTIDKTQNILIWLSKESLEVSSFATSLSSEMNVSFPDGDDQKELPIPEQFVHTVKAGAITSEVSDLYH